MIINKNSPKSAKNEQTIEVLKVLKIKGQWKF